MAIVLIFIAVDQLTKQFAIAQSWAVYNSQLALSLFSFSRTAVWAMILFLGVICWLRKKNLVGLTPFLFLVSGGITNLIDRIFREGVVDWIPILRTGLYNNLADYMIAIGVVMIGVKLIYEIRHSHSL